MNVPGVPGVPEVPEIPDLATTVPDLVVGPYSVYFAWQPRCSVPQLTPPAEPVLPSIPKGILVRHVDPANGDDCVAWLTWASTSAAEPEWTLVSLDPLTIGEAFTCSRCGLTGGIRDGQWWLGLAE